ncbi:TonB-dependent receptor [Candidatus Dependentiae bacterium]|nr:TonB-dependent receptor [Candidatus Dependentiae bacterium]
MKKVTEVCTKGIFIFLILFLLPCSVFSENIHGFLTGRIIDKETSSVLYDVNIVQDDSVEFYYSNERGEYLLLLPAGKHKISFSKLGYISETIEVDIKKGDSKSLNISLIKDTSIHETIVVTGTRTERRIKDTPIRTEVISSKEIENKNASNLYEALEGNVGIRVEQQCSYCNFGMVRMQGLSGDHTQVLIDGEPIYTGIAGVYGLQQIPASMIERIEIIKGAGSALYGSSAIGGAINIITKTPIQTGSKINVELGSKNTNKFCFNNTIRKGKWGAAFFAQKNEAGVIDQTGDGWKTGPDGASDRVKSDSFSAGFNLRGNNVLFGNDVLMCSGQTINEMRKGGILETIENPYAEASEHIKTNRYQATIGYKKHFTDKKMLSFSFASAIHKRTATNDTFIGDYTETHSGNYPGTDIMQPYTAEEDSYVGNLSYYHILMDKHHLLIGFQCVYDSLKESGKYVIIDSSSPNYGADYLSISEKSALEYGLFIQDEFHINNNIELVFGARYDSHHSKDKFGGSSKIANIENVELKYNESSFNPRMAVSYKVKSINIRASIGTGFRVPYGFSEDLHLCSGSPKINKPAGLKPEKSLSYNFGIDYFKKNFDISINLFRTDLTDKIGFADAGDESKSLGYDYEWQNIDSGYTQGIELKMRLNLIGDFGININSGYTDAKYENKRDDWKNTNYYDESQNISRVPKFTSVMELFYETQGLTVSLSGDYTGRMYIDYCEEDDSSSPNSKIVHTPDFTIVNMKIRKTLFKNFDGYIGAKNLFDYVQPEKHTDDAAFMYAPAYGRLFYAGINLDF